MISTEVFMVVIVILLLFVGYVAMEKNNEDDELRSKLLEYKLEQTQSKLNDLERRPEPVLIGAPYGYPYPYRYKRYGGYPYRPPYHRPYRHRRYRSRFGGGYKPYQTLGHHVIKQKPGLEPKDKPKPQP